MLATSCNPLSNGRALYQYQLRTDMLSVYFYMLAGLDGFTLSIESVDSLPDFAEKLDKKTLISFSSSQQTGMVAVIREATVCAIVLLSPKLSDCILNKELPRHLARLQSDPKASISTNTCILIGRLGPSLGYNTKRKVLVPAFSMALKDSFVHACVAGVMTFMATVPRYKEKLVRDQAFKAVELFVKRLEAHASTMPETASTEDGEDLQVRLPGAYTQAGLVNSATGAAAALTGWAVSSLDLPLSLPLRICKQYLTSSTTDASISTLSINGRASSPPVSSASPSTNPLRSKGLQLGRNKAPTSALAEAGQGSGYLWNDDLIDINAGEGDWRAFESIPPAAESKLASATNGLGFGISLRVSSPIMYHVLRNFPTDLSDIIPDDWGAMASSSRPTSHSPDPWRTSNPPYQISCTLSPQPCRSIAPSTLAPAFSPTSSARSTPVSFPATATSTPTPSSVADPQPKTVESQEPPANEPHEVASEESTCNESGDHKTVTAQERKPLQIPDDIRVRIMPENLKDYFSPTVYHKDRMFASPPASDISPVMAVAQKGESLEINLTIQHTDVWMDVRLGKERHKGR
ncbi:hypothetical protein F4604DRAFT_1935102 [Suillus subluteus]|nr:hypothetical protein F4604DRAFT_1935102 [Suillus subluteus]